MRLRGEEYSKRLESFSHFTFVLIAVADSMDTETACKSSDITTDSELSEEQVIEKLIEIINANPKKSQPVSYEDALIIVCDAIEEGHFCDLYEILDRNATLILVDDEKIFNGNREIINFLVQERFDHLYCSDEKTITCDILKIVKGERYGVGEKCILLIYRLQNGEREHRVSKIYSTNGIIKKLEFYRPYGPMQLVAEE